VSTIAPPTPAVQPAASGGRGFAIGIGGVLATVGTGLALGAGGIFAVAGSDGTFESGRAALSTPTTALVSDVARIQDTSEAATLIGQPRLKLSADGRDGARVFVGVAPAAAVDRYLAGAPVDEVTDFDVDPFTLDRTTHDGTAAPKAPADQSFWVASSAGHSAAIDWKISDGDYKVVVMNADGSRGVSTDGDASLVLPNLPDITLVMLIAGLVMIGGGIALIVPSLAKRTS
jgi:hypothetical protein